MFSSPLYPLLMIIGSHLFLTELPVAQLNVTHGMLCPSGLRSLVPGSLSAYVLSYHFH
jgi:hypothetical protein